MPIYCLLQLPGTIRDHAWAASPYSGDLWVNGADEGEAHGLAAGRYDDTRSNTTGAGPQPGP